MADAGTPTYPVKTIAKLLRLTERRVQQLSKEGVIPKAERGRYELAPAVQGYIGYLQDRVAPKPDDGGGIDYHVEKARKTKAEADIAEMEAAKMRGDLVDAVEMKQAMDLVISEVRAKLLNNAPTRIAARAKSENKEASIKAIAKEEITAALLALSKTDPADLVGTSR
ncbi:terminase small subunit, Nu1 [Ascidiaceihabitans sp.]|uniref:terminase small subunit, Nu1 n=1 Tax=Ascidiaceihabitans sp. TaxID=1872644 RepID=UPI003297249C